MQSEHDRCNEVQQNTGTNTIFILAAILLKLIALAVYSGMAVESCKKSELLTAIV